MQALTSDNILSDNSNSLSSSVSNLAILPIELLNEPFSFLDTGDRPEMVVYRSDFLFMVHRDGSSLAVIGSREIRREAPRDYWRASNKPDRDSTFFSLINIYDTYGLSIVKSFLQHLICSKDEMNTNWLACYLLGSLAVIDPESEEIEREGQDLNHLSNILLLRLSALASLEPRATEALTNAPCLPIELLAKILNSTRISKSLSSVVLAIRAQIKPNEDELRESIYPDTMHVHNRFVCTWVDIYQFSEGWDSLGGYGLQMGCPVIHEWCMTVDRDTYRLEHLVGDEVEDDECDGYTSVRSMNVYEAICNSRGCNGPSVVISMLNEMSQRLSSVTDSNVSEVCSWIVQLSHDSEDGIAKTMLGYESLRIELQRLIQSHIGKMGARSEKRVM
ncbi:Hypothetical protein POVR2_LOCUS91 [uncultured virus]|nr:Hypothetical protein POVR2_LOCUS91 [uncultured virus]